VSPNAALGASSFLHPYTNNPSKLIKDGFGINDIVNASVASPSQANTYTAGPYPPEIEAELNLRGFATTGLPSRLVIFRLHRLEKRRIKVINASRIIMDGQTTEPEVELADPEVAPLGSESYAKPVMILIERGVADTAELGIEMNGLNVRRFLLGLAGQQASGPVRLDFTAANYASPLDPLDTLPYRLMLVAEGIKLKMTTVAENTELQGGIMTNADVTGPSSPNPAIVRMITLRRETSPSADSASADGSLEDIGPRHVWPETYYYGPE
jgi:hypothetical protein